jgi:spore germination cell wall hydrolase CwlJ-like protein
MPFARISGNEEQKNEIPAPEKIEDEPLPIEVTPIGPTIEEEHLNEERYCLSLNIYHESRGDNFAGRAAVADVVMNRVEDTYYPDTVCEVVKQTVWVENWKGNMVPKRNMCQFSWFCDGKGDEPGDPDAWTKSYMIAQEVYDKGNWRGITEGATHYHSLQVRPKWIKDRGMFYTGTIGQHEFYRWER